MTGRVCAYCRGRRRVYTRNGVRACPVCTGTSDGGMNRAHNLSIAAVAFREGRTEWWQIAGAIRVARSLGEDAIIRITGLSREQIRAALNGQESMPV